MATSVDCPYLPGRQFIQRYVFADDLSSQELGAFLEAGWRHFGQYFFRPECPVCRACEPVKLVVGELQSSASQRRVLKLNQDVTFRLVEPHYTEEYYDLWAHHSWKRFGRQVERSDFHESFCVPAGPGFFTEYRIENRLAGLGFCDLTDQGLSSVYFVFHQDFAKRSLGIYSVLRESQLAVELGLRWYYLGYWIRQNPTMAYKGRFHPRRVLNWDTGVWESG